jgi:hypothetical protein
MNDDVFCNKIYMTHRHEIRRHIFHVIYKLGSEIDLLFLCFNKWRKITLKLLFRQHSDYPKFLFVPAIKLKKKLS